MLDLKFIRENPDIVRRAIELKGEKDHVDEILRLDARRRELIKKGDMLKARRNDVTEEIANLKKQGKDATELIEEMRKVSDEIKAIDSELKKVELELENFLLWVPNIPHESVPIGKDKEDNVVVRTWGEIQEFDFEIKDHLTLGKKLGIIDFECGAKLTGSGFPVYIGKGATLERALINFMLDLHIQKHGYVEVFPPFLVNEASMRGTGQIPKLKDDMYYCPEDDLYLIPTAEVPVTNIHRDEILDISELPKKYVAYSACFRREAGSWGRETRGFLRVHQFNKVELVKFTTPESSYDELEALVRDAEEVLQLLNIPYRVVLLCTGDMSFSSAKTYDIEVWSPAEKKWLEASSCSNFEDFQARRMNIRFRRDKKSKPEFVHTLNGSGLATSRLMVALLENYQTPEGKVIVPKVLHKYTGFTIIE
ncbi:seryl-tRNA synthetase [Candidatus Kryptonium thompsonii]|uniref:Serine--tRNA ligase n=1 Tax=Candidatus Kryptonium thompsonii TaxID=1633631 RepID=A0A0P1L5S0_9BACT|nr:serine--tRNA ligase [Candidatus Kryptonium thompsoni]CUS76417.1 seryl-tRNA synthetase [Candidatus Kryptonium thompsoni]CUS82956.1 seryl-tRNA synthetase [Candidatus Kryptonium thompsoni]CUS87585.1 seryl-tRNA synthetase [Candidatus Kryptonium thompsoni]CUS95612.1 seryl-tRNA synthetase [Candidatus Kryptonium thompsoni]CUT02125.1 seryl-tRNA synthetase [Candidatus Kryptonium thompsoni]